MHVHLYKRVDAHRKVHLLTGPHAHHATYPDKPRSRKGPEGRGSIQPMQVDRGEMLRALLVANGGKMLAKDARQKMHLSKQTFSMLLAAMNEYIEKKPLHSDKRKDVLLLK